MNSTLIQLLIIYFIESNAFISTSDNPFIVFSDFIDIRIAKLNTNNALINSNETEILYKKKDSKLSYGIDYSLSGNLLLWNNQISNIAVPFHNNLNNSLGIVKQKVLNIQKFHELARIAFDWIHDLLYWTADTEIQVISIKNTKLRYVVIENGFDVIRNLAVDPLESFIFWIQWDNSGKNDRIMRSYEDGSNITVIVDFDLKYSYGISLDLQNKTIYWIDAQLYTLSCIDYNGNNRRVVIKSYDLFSVSYRMDLFGDYIFWTNDRYKSVLKTHKSGLNKTSRLIVIKSNTYIDALKIVHPLRQPFSKNRCLHSNCSHLCLPSGVNEFRCLCPSIRYYKFTENEKCNTEVIIA